MLFFFFVPCKTCQGLLRPSNSVGSTGNPYPPIFYFCWLQLQPSKKDRLLFFYFSLLQLHPLSSITTFFFIFSPPPPPPPLSSNGRYLTATSGTTSTAVGSGQPFALGTFVEREQTGGRAEDLCSSQSDARRCVAKALCRPLEMCRRHV